VLSSSVMVICNPDAAPCLEVVTGDEECPLGENKRMLIAACLPPGEHEHEHEACMETCKYPCSPTTAFDGWMDR
jgi:hypothetical protein